MVEKDAKHLSAAVSLLQALPKFRSEDGTAYATVEGRGDLDMRSADFRSWYAAKLWNESKETMPVWQFQNAIDIACGGNIPVQKQYMRVAGSAAEGIFIDNVGGSGGIIHVTKLGWQYVQSCPYKFKRPSGQLPLPEPETNGVLSSLYALPFRCDELEQRLFAAWLLAAMCPFEKFPFPLLVLEGPAGSGKTTLLRIARALTDPIEDEPAGLPNNEYDLCLLAQESRVVVLDNVSGLTKPLSNRLCQFATGGTFATKKHYENNKTVKLPLHNPTVITGITNVAKYPDLMSRSLKLTLNQIEATEVREEASLWETFESLSGEIFGGILNALVEALENWPTTLLHRRPRMADFARFTAAGAGAIGATTNVLVEALLEVQAGQQAEAATGVLPVEAIKVVLAEKSIWTANELLEAVPDLRRAGLSQRSLKATLTQYAGALAANGIAFQTGPRGTGGVRTFSLSLAPAAVPNRQLVTNVVTIG